jgi:hypothetical protein
MTMRHGLYALLVLAGCASTQAGDRSFRDHVLTSRATPEIALQIDADFASLPVQIFPIETMTNAERRVFVEAGADRVVRRMIVVQFERTQEGSDFRFRYPSRPPRQFGENVYRFGAYVYDDASAAQREPTREASRTRALLVAQGYAPPRLWRTSRLARVTDPDGLTEIIIFYMENADAEYPAGPLPGADEDGDLVLEGEAREALARRMEAATRPLRG